MRFKVEFPSLPPPPDGKSTILESEEELEAMLTLLEECSTNDGVERVVLVTDGMGMKRRIAF